MKTWPPKDPDEKLDYGFDWSPRDLGSSTIASSTATVTEGDITVDAHGPGEVEDTPSGAGTVTRLSGGTEGTACEIVLHAILTSGEEMDETLKIKIKER